MTSVRRHDAAPLRETGTGRAFPNLGLGRRRTTYPPPMPAEIYLDHAASTPPASPVIEVMTHAMLAGYGNAASVHLRGRRAAQSLDQARERVAALLGTAAQRLVFTSGATEALNIAIKGIAAGCEPGAQLAVSATEHKAVLHASEAAAAANALQLVEVGVGPDGVIDLDELERVCGAGPVGLVALMMANNETGVLQPIAEAAEIAHASGAPFLCDATQAAGKVPVRLDELRVDWAAISAHKLHGPQGVGVLVRPPRMPSGFVPLIHGGGHEGGLRSGSSNVAGAVGLGVAAELAIEGLEERARTVAALRGRLEGALVAQLSAEPIGAGVRRLPGHACLRISGVDGEALVARTPAVAFSTGSACTSSVPSPSHVLLAMGMSPEAAEETIRLSLGRDTTEAEVDAAVEALVLSASALRELVA